MKAAKRIRDYLYVLKRDTPARSRISVLPGAEPLTAQDLEKVLARLDEERAALKAAEQEQEEMLNELSKALWPTQPTYPRHRFSTMLTTIRNRTATPYAVLSQERAERERLASQLREVEGTALLYRTLRQALREVCEAVLPAYKDKDPGQQLAALQQQIVRERDAVESAREQRTEANDELHTVKGINRGLTTALDETFAAIHTLYRELGGDPGILPINDGPRMLNYLSGRIKQRELGAAEPAIAAKVNQALTGVQSKLRDTMAERDAAQQQLREQGDAAADLHELRIKISQICAQRTGGAPGGNAYTQLNQIQACMQTAENCAASLQDKIQEIYDAHSTWPKSSVVTALGQLDRINTWLTHAPREQKAEQELRRLRTGLTDLLGVGTVDFTDWSNE